MERKRASWGTLGLLILVGLALFLRGLADSPTSGEVKPKSSAKPVALPAKADESVRLTGTSTEDDHPAAVRGPEGQVWMAYVAYTSGQPVEEDAVKNGEFDSLIPQGHGDQILLRSADGGEWGPDIPVTGTGLEVWRPTVAVDGQGRVVVSWPQNVDGDWEILSRIYNSVKEEWSETVNVSQNEGSDIQVVSTTDANGRVWLAWQSWQEDRFGIAHSVPGHRARERIRMPDGNAWTPALAADSKGNVYLAFDYYDGSKNAYNIRLQRLRVTPERNLTELTKVLRSPQALMRPDIVCDEQDRLWIAYEEGAEQWGKDYSDPDYGWEGLKESPGTGLYKDRTVRLGCLVDGTVKEPTADLQAALKKKLPRNRSLPQVGFDSNGGLWLLARHHRTEGGQGEAWVSYALRYNGKSWSQPRKVPNSSNILDNRPALLPFRDGILAVHSSDSRTNARKREQSDVFATLLATSDQTNPPELKPAEPAPEPELEPVHPKEEADVARLRNHRVKVGDKSLKLLRGEFHRHTEYTAHRDKDGTLEDSWRYALDAADLDWMGNGDHDGGYHEYLWWQIEKICSFFNHPQRFTAAMTRERSLNYPDGHRNVMLPRRGIRPLPRGPRKPSSPATGTPDTQMLYEFLKEFDGICSVHTSATGMGTDWRDNDPEVEPVVEIYQGLRHNYEHEGAPRSGGNKPKGFVWKALEKGHRLGFQCSSDHYNTHISFGIVLAEENTRRGIIDAFKKRHCYAATDNILLVVRSGEHLMGDEFQTDEPPVLEIEAVGTTPIAKVHIIRDNKYLFTAETDQQKVRLSYTDSEARPGESHYYYVRVEQDDENLAWASPMWITYQP